MKTCSKCKLEKDESCFHVRKRSKDGLSYYCKKCGSINSAHQYASNPEKARTYNRKWYADNPGKRLGNSLRNKHGLTIEAYQKLLIAQGNVCAICGKSCSRRGRLSVDHSHVSGQIRGLLCSKCNLGLGNFDDSVEKLRWAEEYLKIWS